MDPQPVRIRGDVVLLQALLKMLNVVQTGGEVKEFLANERVLLNGEPENRRSKQLRNGDVIGLPDGRVVQIVTE